MHSLNQIVGYAKFINRSYGQVYYRGQCALYNNMRPSLFRSEHSSTVKIEPRIDKLNHTVRAVMDDPRLMKILFTEKIATTLPEKEIVECILQHYGGKTRYIDLVDTLWVALWMGQFHYRVIKQQQSYAHYVQRAPSFFDGASLDQEEFYQYILLSAIPEVKGVTAKGYRKIDLRQELPSTFLRPHAQHALAVRKAPPGGSRVQSYDFASNIVGILKIRIDRASAWIGNGLLLSQENLFPPPAYDHGYDILLSRNDVFCQPDFLITKYV